MDSSSNFLQKFLMLHVILVSRGPQIYQILLLCRYPLLIKLIIIIIIRRILLLIIL